jgi:mRNA interferase MazF
VIVSPDELNASMGTFIVAPLTSGGFSYPFRVRCLFDGKQGYVVPDQLRTVDRERLVRRLGPLPADTMAEVLDVLLAMFAP